MLLETTTALRVLTGVLGVGYSIYARSQDKEFTFDKVTEAIFGQAIGGLFYDWFKSGTDLAYTKFLKSLDSPNKTSLNHDLQHAAAKAQAFATFFACQAALVDVKHNKSFGSTSSDIHRWEDADVSWLTKLSSSLRASINTKPASTFDQHLNYKEVFTIFSRSTTDLQYKEIIRQGVVDSIKTTYYGVAFSEAAFNLLKDKIENGWQEFPENNELIVQLKLKQRLEYFDWFELVCIFFNEEYKKNTRIQAAIGKELQFEQLNLLNNISESLASLGTVNIDEILNDLSEFREEAYNLHNLTHQQLEATQEQNRFTHEKLREIKDSLEKFARDTNNDISIEDDLTETLNRKRNRNKSISETGTVLNDFFDFGRPTKFFNRAGELSFLRDSVLRGSQPITVIKGAGGFGKTSLENTF
jgi:hypothetical protein